MHDGLQVLLQLEDAGQSWCAGFTGLAIAKPTHLIVRGISPAQGWLARQVVRALYEALLHLHPRIRSSLWGASGPPPEELLSFDNPACTRVLILVGDGTTPLLPTDPIHRTLETAPPQKVVVLLKRPASATLAGPLSRYQAQFYEHAPSETLPAILQAASLVSEERRVFISYRRRDASALAEQLFDALGHLGYQAFLDCFSIPPGVDFHARLHQELADKALVLVIESRHLAKSEWVPYEINFARAFRLGLLALHLPFGTMRPEIRSRYRYRVDLRDFGGLGVLPHLRKEPLARVVQWISAHHEAFLARRRYILRQSMRRALRLQGLPSTLDSSGLLRTVGNEEARYWKDYRLWLTPRVPEVGDFQHVHGALQRDDLGIVIGPEATWDQERTQLLRWMERVSEVRHFDESRILRVAQAIRQGSL